MVVTEAQINEWENNNYPWKITDSSKFKIVRNNNHVIKNIIIIIFILIALAFLCIVGLRTYYYEYFQDSVETTNECNPITNIEAVKCSDVQCGNVSVNCNCINATDIQTLLNSVCPDNISIYINNTI